MKLRWAATGAAGVARHGRWIVGPARWAWGALAAALLAAPAGAQVTGATAANAVMVIKGHTALITQPVALHRLSIADPEVAEVVAVSAREVLVNGKAIGSTSLLLWDESGSRRLYTVEVVPDTSALQQTLRALFPSEQVRISLSGRSLVLSGQVSDASAAQRIAEVVEASGATVLNYLMAPPAPQVMLQVRFAEVTRTAMTQFGAQIGVVRLDGAAGARDRSAETSSNEGVVRLSLLEPGISIDAVLQALQSRGQFRSLAEPNLIARNNEEASFLAGGEFPFPVAQGGGAFNMVTVVWKEFGVRLRFKPTILPNGVIRLKIAPEVSSLDFSNSLRLSGFLIPSLLTRRAETEVELREGQYLAIAGLLDNSLRSSVGKIPLLGDIPILGELFRSRDSRRARTELLVLVSPRLVSPSDAPIPLPTDTPDAGERKLVRPGGGSENR